MAVVMGFDAYMFDIFVNYIITLSCLIAKT